MDKEQIMRRGSILFRVQRSGMYQKLNFIVKYEEMPDGKVPYLSTEKFVDPPELLRLCKESDLPVHAKNGKFFPEGKTALDFLIPTSPA